MTRWIVNHTPFRHGEADLTPGMEYDGPALPHLIEAAIIVDAESDRGKLLVERLALIAEGEAPVPFMDVNYLDAAVGVIGDQDNPGTAPEETQSVQSENIEAVINRLNAAGMDVVVETPPSDVDGQVVGSIQPTGELSAETLALLDEEEEDAGDKGDGPVAESDLTEDSTPADTTQEDETPPADDTQEDVVPASIKHVPGTSTWKVVRGEAVVDGPMPKADAEAKVAELNAVAGA